MDTVINRARRRLGHKYTKIQNIACLGKIMFVYNKQHLSNI